MKCEICDIQPASMWVQPPLPNSTMVLLTSETEASWLVPTPIPSCDDCGPQLGYKILAPLEPSTTR